jgi:hypothetical protein
MALDYAQIDAVTNKVYIPKLVDNIFNTYPVLTWLRDRLDDSHDGGTSIVQPIMYAKNAQVTTYADYSTLTTTANDELTAVAFSWGHYAVPLTISRTDELKNSGTAKIVSLLSAKMQVAEKSLADKLTTDLFAASAVTGGLAGFPTLIGSTTDCGGISSTDFAGWASSVDSTTAVLTIGAMIDKFNDCSDGTDTPTHILMNYDCMTKYYQLLEVKPEFRVQNNETGGLMFNGAKIMVDKGVGGSGAGTGDNQILFCNDKYLSLIVHPKDNFVARGWQDIPNQMVRLNVISWSGQLATSNRRRHGKFTAIDPAK